MRIRVAICLEDTVYTDKLTAFFTSHYGDSVEIYSFSEQNLLRKYLETHVMDVLLVDETFDSRVVAEWPEIIIFKLLQHTSFKEEGDGSICIGKYQKASAIYQEILHYSSQKQNFSVKRGSNRTIVISFAGAVGGVGATTISTAFAVYLARQGRKVLFLDMDDFGDTSVQLGAGGNYTFEEILLALKTKNRSLSVKLQSAVSKTEEEVFFYSSCDNPVDFSQMSADETKELIGAITELDYQYVVIDFHMSLTDRIKAIMNASDKIIVVSDGTLQSKVRFEKIYKALKAIDGIDRTRNTDKLAIFNNLIEKGKGLDISNSNVPNIGAMSIVNMDDSREISRYIAGKLEVFKELG